jgi:hypothetical protein
MKSKQNAILLGIIVVLALLFALPATRDELDWRWTQSRDQEADYMQYLTDWPKGRHIAEARLRYEQRTWIDAKKAMINEAIKQNKMEKSDPEAQQERRQRLERFFWKQVTNENTVVSYQDYLLRYPNGDFAAEARRQIESGSKPASGGNGASSPQP